jgi:hypothetical protein
MNNQRDIIDTAETYLSETLDAEKQYLAEGGDNADLVEALEYLKALVHHDVQENFLS